VCNVSSEKSVGLGIVTWSVLYVAVQKEGVEKVLGLGKMLDTEVNAVKQGLPELQKNIKKGEEFVEKNPPASI